MKKTINGISLIEIMIAVLVIGVAFFGFMKLLSSSLKSTSYANQQKQINLAGQYILDRINANLEGGTDPNYYAQGNAWLNNNPTPATLCNAGTTCTQVQQRAFDLFQWQQYLATLRISGLRGIVCLDNAVPGVPTLNSPNCNAGTRLYIKLFWQNNLAANESGNVRNYLIIPVLATTNLALSPVDNLGEVEEENYVNIANLNISFYGSGANNIPWNLQMPDTGGVLSTNCDANKTCSYAIVNGTCTSTGYCNNAIVFGSCTGSSSTCNGSIIFGSCSNSRICQAAIIYGDCDGSAQCQGSIITGSCSGSANCTNAYVLGTCTGGSVCNGAVVTTPCPQWKACGNVSSNSLSTSTVIDGNTIDFAPDKNFFDNNITIKKSLYGNCSGANCDNVAISGSCLGDSSCQNSVIDLNCSGSSVNCSYSLINGYCNNGANCNNSYIWGNCDGAQTSCKNSKIFGTCTNGADCTGSTML